MTEKEFLNYLKKHNLVILEHKEFQEKVEEGYLLDDALSLLVELNKDDPSCFCEELHEHPEENNYCSKNCIDFNKECVLRYLKATQYRSNNTPSSAPEQ